MLNKVINYIKENELIKQEDKILVALSGGPDSVCLLHILYELKDKFNLDLGAIHINHMLRGNESDADEKYIINLCDELGIKHYVKRINIEYVAKDSNVSLEVAGRNERYKTFEEIRNKYNYNKIAVAHNANDQAETVLMRIMRGTGLEGLTGIKPKREDGVIRPILCLNRQEIEGYCEEKKLNPRIDASNYERIYSRNKVRLDILPYMKEHFNKDIIDTFNRMTLLLQKDNEFIEEYSKKCYNIYCENYDKKLKVSKELFKKEMDAIITRVVIRAFKEISNSHQNFEMKHIYEIVNLAGKGTGKKINLTNRIICENLYGDIIFSIKNTGKKNISKDYEIRINKDELVNKITFDNYDITFEIVDNKKEGNFPKNNLIKLFDYDNIKKEIVIRYRKDGDKIVPLGMNGSKKLKDIFIDLKISREYRDSIPILCFDDKISWVVGCKTSQLFKVTKDTKKILKITIDRKE
ncbi:tRNA lysidine(34) synthetase TilS [uncultured Clostridium sp.]|uniref:tRNA lysidine(34) synthetase TilS n=1 Tax=uncultured Clostridium sp. TaxID=59620 RepID=UPI0026376465|nr:tRNA lysidine(34) synthetase TilS [uncultured Clostridium sp.]